jgi:aryl-alcohol dehydrogenase-like predicted oxidoreductase
VVEQPEYNMISRTRVEIEYAPLYRKFNLGLTVFSPLRRGILTGKYNKGIPSGSRADKEGSWFKEEVEKGGDMLERVSRLEPLAKELGEGVTTGQLALAWTLKHPNVSSAIIGATSVEQVRENLKAVELVEKIDKGLMDRIDEVLGNRPEGVPFRFD